LRPNIFAAASGKYALGRAVGFRPGRARLAGELAPPLRYCCRAGRLRRLNWAGGAPESSNAADDSGPPGRR
jgi:hypothetical protein